MIKGDGKLLIDEEGSDRRYRYYDYERDEGRSLFRRKEGNNRYRKRKEEWNRKEGIRKIRNRKNRRCGIRDGEKEKKKGKVDGKEKCDEVRSYVE